MFKRKKIEKRYILDSKWKEKNTEYLNELQKFLDKVDNVENEELKLSIIYQMLKCDEVLTNLSESLFKKYYIEGYKNNLKV